MDELLKDEETGTDTHSGDMANGKKSSVLANEDANRLLSLSRQAVGCQQGSLARQVRRVPSRSPEER